MGSFSRWLDYAKTKVEMAVRSGNRELDELEAEREAATADRPWLRADGDAPTFDEARSRIEWQAEQAARGATPPSPDRGSMPAGAPTPGAASPPPTAETAIASPEDQTRAAEVAGARLELDARQRESAARLDAIRDELGIDPPSTP